MGEPMCGNYSHVFPSGSAMCQCGAIGATQMLPPLAAPPVVVPVDAARVPCPECDGTGSVFYAIPNMGDDLQICRTCVGEKQVSADSVANIGPRLLYQQLTALRSRLTAVEQELKSWEDLTNVHGDGQRLRDQHRALLAAARSPSDQEGR